MLKHFLGRIIKRQTRQWTEREIRELISASDFSNAKSCVELLHTATPDRDLIKKCLLGEIAFRQHDDAEASRLFDEVLKDAPGFPEGHYGLSLLKQAINDFDGAFQHALFASNGAPATARFQAQLGLCHLNLGNLPSAEETLSRALRHDAKDRFAWNNLGIILLAKGKPLEARACFVTALRLTPGFGPALENLRRLDAEAAEAGLRIDVEARDATGVVERYLDEDDRALNGDDLNIDTSQSWYRRWFRLITDFKQGQRDTAFAEMEAMLMDWPDEPVIAVLADRLYRRASDPDSGLAVLQAFLLRHQENSLVSQGLGEALLHYADYAEAEKHLRRAIEFGLSSERLDKALTIALNRQDRYEESLAIHERCYLANPTDQNKAQLAVAHYQNCRYEEALPVLQDLASRGLMGHLGLQSVYAQTLGYMGFVDEALPMLDELISRFSNAPQLRMSRAIFRLLTHDFVNGWEDYHHRQTSQSRFFRVLPVSVWTGESLRGKTIVILAEQGLGDQIMFASCLPDLLALGPKRVVVEAVSRVAETLARSFPECEVIGSKQDKRLDWLRDIENVDCYVALGELPRYFRKSLDAFPRRAYLVPDTTRVAYWRKRLEALGPGPYLGTSWRGGTELTRRAVRTMSVDQLRPLVTARPARWVSLQYGEVREDLALASDIGMELTHWAEAISDLDEFAALVAALDGVFTVCNTTVHYAGAVGQKVWVLAPHVPEWRYGLHSEHMPWYPNVTVLRQPFANAWPEIVGLAKQALVDNF